MSTIDTIVHEIDTALDKNDRVFTNGHYRYRLDELDSDLGEIRDADYVYSDYVDYTTGRRFDSERGRGAARIMRIS